MSEDSIDSRTKLLGINKYDYSSSRVENYVDPYRTLTKVYKRRWYIVILFSSLVIIQNIIWNTWAPISSSAEAVFNWNSADMSLFANWGTICFVLFVLPFAWLINTKGLRVSVVIASLLIAIGAFLRCFTVEPYLATRLVNAAQLINGISGPVIMSVPSALSAVWFPEFQRTTATAIAASSGILGVAVSFVLGPLLVSEPNLTAIIHDGSGNHTDISIQRAQIMNLMYIEFGIALGLFLLILVYFPDKPPRPPTMSASIARFNFKEGFSLLIRNRQFLIICLCYGLFNGVYFGWMAILTPFLSHENFSQIESGWLGFYALIAGQVVSLILSWFLDQLTRKMKLTIILLKIIYLGNIIWMLLIWRKIILYSKVSIYIICIVLSACNLGSIPVFYELAIEAMYPINEGVITGVINMFTNGVMIIFLTLQIILSKNSLETSEDQEWMIWCLLASVIISLPLIIHFKGIYNRLKIDNDYRKSLLSSSS